MRTAIFGKMRHRGKPRGRSGKGFCSSLNRIIKEMGSQRTAGRGDFGLDFLTEIGVDGTAL